MSSESDNRYVDFQDDLSRISNEIENKIKNYVVDKEYGTELEDIGVIPIIIKFNEEMEKEGWFKERVLFKKSKKDADIRLRIDFDKFVKGDTEKKKLLLIDNVIRSVRAISKKAKKDFRAHELEADILKLFNLTAKDLEAL
jgi:hypothetical protein